MKTEHNSITLLQSPEGLHFLLKPAFYFNKLSNIESCYAVAVFGKAEIKQCFTKPIPKHISMAICLYSFFSSFIYDDRVGCLQQIL